MSNLTPRANTNEYNCQQGVGYILYALANFGLLAEPYSQLISGADNIELTHGQQHMLLLAKQDVAELIILFADEIKTEGKIIADELGPE